MPRTMRPGRWPRSAAGCWSTAGGGRVIFVAGTIAYIAAYTGFALGATSIGWLAFFFCLAGCGIGFAETAESTIVARTVPAELRGTGFGGLGLVQAGGDLLATVVAGVLFTFVAASAAFLYAAGWMVLAVVASAAVTPKNTWAPLAER